MSGEAGDGQARHQEGVEDAVLDEIDAARRLAFVVVAIVAAEGDAVEGGEGGIVGDAEEGGQDLLAEQLGEGLAFVVAALTLAFEAVAEDLVEEDGGGAAAEDRRAVEGLSDGSFAEGDEVLGHRDGLVGQGLLVGEMRSVVGLEGLGAEEVHTVGGAGAGDDDKTGDVAGCGDFSSFRGDEVVGLGGGLKGDVVEEDLGILLEDAGELAKAILPGVAVDDENRRGREQIIGRLVFIGEVCGTVLFFGADLLLGLHLEVAVEGFGVAAVGGEPEAASEGGSVVGQGERDGGECAVAMVAVGVVLGWGAEANLDVGDAAATLVRGNDGAKLRGHGNAVGVGDGIAEEVGLGLLGGIGRVVSEGVHRAMQLGLHGVDEDRCRTWHRI